MPRPLSFTDNTSTVTGTIAVVCVRSCRRTDIRKLFKVQNFELHGRNHAEELWKRKALNTPSAGTGLEEITVGAAEGDRSRSQSSGWMTDTHRPVDGCCWDTNHRRDDPVSTYSCVLHSSADFYNGFILSQCANII